MNSLGRDRICTAHGRTHTHCGTCEGYHRQEDCIYYKKSQREKALSILGSYLKNGGTNYETARNRVWTQTGLDLENMETE